MCDELCFPIHPSRKKGNISTRESTATRLKLDRSTFILWVGVIISAAVWEFTLLISAHWEWIRPDLSNYKSSRNSPFHVISFWWQNFKGPFQILSRRKEYLTECAVCQLVTTKRHTAESPTALTREHEPEVNIVFRCPWMARTGHRKLIVYFQAHSLGWVMSTSSWAHLLGGQS